MSITYFLIQVNGEWRQIALAGNQALTEWGICAHGSMGCYLSSGRSKIDPNVNTRAKSSFLKHFFVRHLSWGLSELEFLKISVFSTLVIDTGRNRSPQNRNISILFK